MVTGGGNGLGRELVLSILAKGGKVVAVDINETALNETAALAGEYEVSLMTITADITDRSFMENLPRIIISRFGAIDAIINNAGIIQPFRKVKDMDMDKIERVIDINFMSTLNAVRAFTPYLLQRPEAHIVNISSMGGFLPVAGQAIYGASKAAVKVMSESLAAELSDTAIGVTTVFPGALYTEIKAHSGVNDAGAGASGHSENAAFPPVKAARIMIRAIERRKVRVYIGRDSKLMNFLYKIMPAFAVKLIYNKMRDKLTSPAVIEFAIKDVKAA